MVKIIQKGDPVLARKAKEVPLADIKKPGIQKIIKQMKTALAKESDGAALAAPQIGLPLCLFVVSGRILAEEKDEENVPEDLVFINPVITKLSKKKAWLEEGCLSVRGYYGKVERATKATITAYNKEGKKFTRGASGLLAQVFQHETDHLDGTLFDSKAKDIERIPLEHATQ